MQIIINSVKIRKDTRNIRGIAPHKCITPHANNTATVSTADTNPPITSHILMSLHLILTLILWAPWRKTLLWKQANSAKCQYLKSEVLKQIQYQYWDLAEMACGKCEQCCVQCHDLVTAVCNYSVCISMGISLQMLFCLETCLSRTQLNSELQCTLHTSFTSENIHITLDNALVIITKIYLLPQTNNYSMFSAFTARQISLAAPTKDSVPFLLLHRAFSYSLFNKTNLCTIIIKHTKNTFTVKGLKCFMRVKFLFSTRHVSIITWPSSGVYSS
jgi:hypothetical protein